MIALIQSLIVLAILIFAVPTASILWAIITRDTGTICWQSAEWVIGVLLGLMAVTTQWSEVRCLRRKPVVLDLRIKGNARAGNGLSDA